MQVLTTADEVIKALGGNSAVERLTASKPNTVSMWRQANKFPSKNYLVMIHALVEVGRTAPTSLWSMKAVESAEQVAS